MIVSRKYGSPLLLSLFAIVMAQGAAQSPSNPSATVPPKKFDVASIRPSPDRTGQPTWIGIQVTGDRFEAREESLESLVWYAYASGGPQRQMVSEEKGWIDSQHWDITAKVDDPSLAGLTNAERDDRIRPMLQALLEERFHLKLHTELRPTSVYALVQAKGGAKVKEVRAPPEVEGDSMEAMKRYREENPGKGFPGSISCSDSGCTATAMTISDAAGSIAANCRLDMDRPVIDETGLKGHYDFSFRTAHSGADDALGDIEEELGLKFESRKMNLTTYVIDSAEKPSPN